MPTTIIRRTARLRDLALGRGTRLLRRALAPALWIDADSVVGVDNDPLTFVDVLDQSSRGNHPTAGAATLKTNIQNGRKVIRLNGTSDYLRGPMAIATEAFTLFQVVIPRQAHEDNVGWFSLFNTGAPNDYDAVNAIVLLSQAAVSGELAQTRFQGVNDLNLTTSGAAIASGTPSLIISRHAGGLASITVNGAEVGTDAYSLHSPIEPTDYLIGCRWVGGNVDVSFCNQLDLCEARLYLADVPAAATETIVAELTARWGL